MASYHSDKSVFLDRGRGSEGIHLTSYDLPQGIFFWRCPLGHAFDGNKVSPSDNPSLCRASAGGVLFSFLSRAHISAFFYVT